MANWQLTPEAREAFVRALTGRKLPKWLTLKRQTKNTAAFWVSFDGITLDPSEGTLTLLSGSKAVATVVVPIPAPGNTLTVLGGGFEGRLEMKVFAA